MYNHVETDAGSTFDNSTWAPLTSSQSFEGLTCRGYSTDFTTLDAKLGDVWICLGDVFRLFRVQIVQVQLQCCALLLYPWLTKGGNSAAESVGVLWKPLPCQWDCALPTTPEHGQRALWQTVPCSGCCDCEASLSLRRSSKARNDFHSSCSVGMHLGGARCSH
jgi:hypothetical protein